MPVLQERKNKVLVLTMSRPDQRNCWGSDYPEEIAAILAEAEDDDGIGCVILTGDEAGKAFCAGANLKDPRAHSASAMDEFVKSLPKKMRDSFPNLLSDFPKPIVAAINGYAVGAGCIMACSCDIAIATERTEWRMPQVNLGIMPQHGATVRLARWIGKGNAMKLALGFPVKAEEGYRMGLAQWLVPHEQLMEQAFAIANSIADLPPLAVRLVKESMTKGADTANLMDTILVDLYRANTLRQTEDSKESHVAWREGRKPEFKGR